MSTSSHERRQEWLTIGLCIVGAANEVIVYVRPSFALLDEGGSYHIGRLNLWQSSISNGLVNLTGGTQAPFLERKAPCETEMTDLPLGFALWQQPN